MGSPDPQQPPGFPRAARALKLLCKPPRPHGRSAFAYTFVPPSTAPSALTALAGHNVHLLASSKGISSPHFSRETLRKPGEAARVSALQANSNRRSPRSAGHSTPAPLARSERAGGRGERLPRAILARATRPFAAPVAGCLRSHSNGWLGKGLASPPPPGGPRMTTARCPGQAGPSLPQAAKAAPDPRRPLPAAGLGNKGAAGAGSQPRPREGERPHLAQPAPRSRVRSAGDGGEGAGDRARAEALGLRPRWQRSGFLTAGRTPSRPEPPSSPTQTPPPPPQLLWLRRQRGARMRGGPGAANTCACARAHSRQRGGTARGGRGVAPC